MNEKRFTTLLLYERSVKLRLFSVDVDSESATTEANCTHSTSTVVATASADFAVLSMLAGTAPPQLEQVPHQGALPDLGTFNINLFVSDAPKGQVLDDLADLIRSAYRAPHLALTG